MALTQKKSEPKGFCKFNFKVLQHYAQERNAFTGDYEFLKTKWAVKDENTAVEWLTEADMIKYQNKFIKGTPYDQVDDWWWEDRQNRERTPLTWWLELRKQYQEFMRNGGGKELALNQILQ